MNKLRALPPAEPLPDDHPDARLWAWPIEEYEYPHYVDHLRRMDPETRALVRRAVRELPPDAVLALERVLESVSTMASKRSEMDVLRLALNIVQLAEQTPERCRDAFELVPSSTIEPRRRR